MAWRVYAFAQSFGLGMVGHPPPVLNGVEWTWEVGGCDRRGATVNGDRFGKPCPPPSKSRSFLFFLPIHIYALLALRFSLQPSSLLPGSRAFFLLLPYPLSQPTAHRRDSRKLKKLLPIDTWRCLVSSLAPSRKRTSASEHLPRMGGRVTARFRITSDNDNAAGRLKIKDDGEGFCGLRFIRGDEMHRAIPAHDKETHFYRSPKRKIPFARSRNQIGEDRGNPADSQTRERNNRRYRVWFGERKKITPVFFLTPILHD